MVYDFGSKILCGLWTSWGWKNIWFIGFQKSLTFFMVLKVRDITILWRKHGFASFFGQKHKIFRRYAPLHDY